MFLRTWITRNTANLNAQPRRINRKKNLAKLHLEALEDRTVPSIDMTGVGIWENRGPGPISADSITGSVNVGGSNIRNPAVGAVEVLAPDMTNKNILYIGTTNGGIWKTTNAYDRDPVWKPLTDQFPSLSISSLSFSPLDATHNTLFAGLGATSNFELVAGPMNTPRILKTTDGGTTWSQLGGATFNGLTLATILPTQLGGSAASQVVLVAAHDPGSIPRDASGNAGLYRSVDGGKTFQKITSFSGKAADGASFTSLTSATVTQIVADPGDSKTFYAGIGQAHIPGKPVQGGGVFKSTDGGLNWVQVTRMTGVSDATRIRLAVFNKKVGTVTQNTIYAGLINDSNELAGVFRSDDRGATWRVMGENGFGDTHPPSLFDGVEKQGGINFGLTVNPNDVNDVYIGGSFVKVTGAIVSSVKQWKLNTNTSQQQHFVWARTAGLFDRPHPDCRDLAFDANGQLLESDDGGVYRRVDHSHWDAVTGSLENTEIHSVAYDALNDRLISGQQDNGVAEESQSGTFLGMHVWKNWLDGDGGNVGVGYVTENGQPQSVRYAMNNNLSSGGFNVKVYRAGNQEVSSFTPSLTGVDPKDTDDELGGEPHQFPFAVNPFNGNRFVLGAHDLYLSNDRGNHLTVLMAATAESDVENTSAVTFGGSLNGQPLPDVVIASFANLTHEDTDFHLYFHDQFGAPMTRVTVEPSIGRIIDIVSDPDDWRKVYVTDGFKIRYTNNITAGVDNWKTISMSASIVTRLQPGNIHCLEVVSPTSTPGDETLLIGADGGVFACRNPLAGSDNWREVGFNLPNAPVFDLHYVPVGTSRASIPTDDVLVVGTMGRGSWILRGALTSVTRDSVMTIRGDSHKVNENDNVRLVRDANNKQLLNVFDTGSTTPPSATIPFAALNKINILGLGGENSLVLDFSNGTPFGNDMVIDYAGGSGNGHFGHMTFAGTDSSTITPTYHLAPNRLISDGTLDFGIAQVNFTNILNVPGVAPRNVSLFVDKPFINEGDTVTVQGSFFDVGKVTRHSVVIQWGDGVITTTVLPDNARTFSVTHAIMEDGSPFILHATVIDQDNLSGEGTAPITVLEVPVAARSLAALTVRGSTDLIPLATFTDPPGGKFKVVQQLGKPPIVTLADYSATIDWGDGTAPSRGFITVNRSVGSGLFTVAGKHAYVNNGTFTATTRINHHGIITQVTSTVTVSTTLVQTKLLTSESGDTVVRPVKTLLVGAANAGDTIRVNPLDRNSPSQMVEVLINNVSQGKFSGLERVELFGQDGNDDIQSKAAIAEFLMVGGKGNDTLTGGVGINTLIGDDGNDTLTGNVGPDFLEGDDGDDTLKGGAGDDILLGGNGKDILDGGPGKNILDAGPGQDGVVIRGTDNNDRIFIGRRVDDQGTYVEAWINGVLSEQIYKNGETVFVFAGQGDDHVEMLPSAGSHWTAELHGEAGNDHLIGGDMDDVLDGGAGHDILAGRAGNDVLIGGEGHDRLSGGIGRNLLIGGNGADKLIGQGSGDLLIAGFTRYDADINALSMILAEWASERPYDERLANLSGVGSAIRLNDNYFVLASYPNATVQDDGHEDTLLGSNGTDWFFARISMKKRDRVFNRILSERLDEL